MDQKLAMIWEAMSKNLSGQAPETPKSPSSKQSDRLAERMSFPSVANGKHFTFDLEKILGSGLFALSRCVYLLHAGADSTVYEAEWLSNGSIVAFKQMTARSRFVSHVYALLVSTGPQRHRRREEARVGA